MFDLAKKKAELTVLGEAIASDLKQCDEQLAGWAVKKQEIERARLVWEGRLAQLTEMEQAAPAQLSAVPDAPTPAPTSVAAADPAI